MASSLFGVLFWVGWVGRGGVTTERSPCFVSAVARVSCARWRRCSLSLRLATRVGSGVWRVGVTSAGSAGVAGAILSSVIAGHRLLLPVLLSFSVLDQHTHSNICSNI